MKFTIQIKINDEWITITNEFGSYVKASSWASRLDNHLYRILENDEVIFGIGD